jgi:hypothetical protein
LWVLLDKSRLEAYLCCRTAFQSDVTERRGRRTLPRPTDVNLWQLKLSSDFYSWWQFMVIYSSIQVTEHKILQQLYVFDQSKTGIKSSNPIRPFLFVFVLSCVSTAHVLRRSWAQRVLQNVVKYSHLHKLILNCGMRQDGGWLRLSEEVLIPWRINNVREPRPEVFLKHYKWMIILHTEPKWIRSKLIS